MLNRFLSHVLALRQRRRLWRIPTGNALLLVDLVVLVDLVLYRRKDEIGNNCRFQLTDAYRLLSASGEPEEAEPAP